MVLVDKAEAARRLGVSVDTVERRLKRGALQGQQEARGNGWRWLIEVPEDAPASAPATNGDTPAVAPAEVTLVATLQEQVTNLQEHIRVMNQALSSRDNLVSELTVVIRQQQIMLPAPEARRRRWWQIFRS